MSTIIKVENLSKKFIISHEERESYTSLRDVITRQVKKTFYFGGKTTKTSSSTEEFWALKDLNFEIKKGDRVGIIGRNGAGKSTLLKILSRITEPTSGKITIDGRVASLLEVGTGFHPELTGRENIFLNGAILGMGRVEIRKKFDEMVAFAEVEKFLDTPVKRYSSGMYVRLAFAVAAHLEPEILIVDEVLAVGDAQFQKKCLGKMEDVSKNEGRTVLFVSHNMGVIQQLCAKAILMSHGQLTDIGDTEKVVDTYLNENRTEKQILIQNVDPTRNHFVYISMVDNNGLGKIDYKFNEELVIDVVTNTPSNNMDLELAMRLIDKYKRGIFTIHEPLIKFYSHGPVCKMRITIPGNFITPGHYSWIICINKPGSETYDVHEDVLSFSILDTGSQFARYEGMDYGCVFANYVIKSNEKQ